jgi:GNAT superfamily N-acetyltransferase
MDTIHIDPANRDHVRDFISLPARIYQTIPQWVPPLDYKHSAAAFFLKYRDGIPVGRLAVLDNRLYNDFNHENTAFFYLFECEPDPASARELFERAFEWARSRGLKKILGPKGFTALDGMGLLVRGFERRPALGLPFNPPYYPQLIESLGFKKASEIVSGYLGTDIQFPQRIHDLADRIRERRGLKIASFQNRRGLRIALRHLKSLYNAALEGTSDGTPITDAEIRSLADQMLWFADPHLIKIVMKDERPVGFLLAYPDISTALQKTKGRLFPFGWLTIMREMRTTDWININGAGMIQEYRGSGGTAILYSEMFKSVAENPRYHHAEVVQIGTDNEKMQREMENFGVDFYKMHRIYQKELV